ncbi:hypothetical protein [Streptacidiphilus jiangxiensis]|uniref:Uncharacterized protein n=1 Tax=Streptacidiphilus jiangxiensis TaxID=235985 RepID=A0A1H8AX65_STRJI|nr:hypothetical protein [Streptacidiphilus jiangxiensis]SEM75076.1 hypothetical protein SAMN05414137_1528 [Streptacidiphilus jiangxiensis]
MSKNKKSNAKNSPRRPRPRPAVRPGTRWADSVRTVALGVITKCASTYALVLIARIVARR